MKIPRISPRGSVNRARSSRAVVLALVALVFVSNPYIFEKVTRTLNASLCQPWIGFNGATRLVGLGDSITSGTNHVISGFRDETSWYSHLVCNDRGYAAAGNFGVSGDTSGEIAKRAVDAIAVHPDVLVIAAGTNDLRDGVQTSQTIGNLETIITLASGIPTVILAKVPPSNSTDVSSLNAGIAALAASKALPVVDFASIIATPGRSADSIHPNTTGAAEIADAIAGIVEREK